VGGFEIYQTIPPITATVEIPMTDIPAINRLLRFKLCFLAGWASRLNLLLIMPELALILILS
jgi:hypothetical protein